MHLNKCFTKVILFVLLIVGFDLAGCGSKGPLYIPEQRYPQDSK